MATVLAPAAWRSASTHNDLTTLVGFKAGVCRNRSCDSYGEDEWVFVDSLEPYKRLVLATASIKL